MKPADVWFTSPGCIWKTQPNGGLLRIARVDREADAPLLSAAPELLEALEECDRVFSRFQPDPMSAYGMAWGEVQTAIAKAKGEA
jgi:hypothetical protein